MLNVLARISLRVAYRFGSGLSRDCPCVEANSLTVRTLRKDERSPVDNPPPFADEGAAVEQRRFYGKEIIASHVLRRVDTIQNNELHILDG